MIYWFCSHVSCVFLWTAQHSNIPLQYTNTSIHMLQYHRCWDCSSSLKCAQQLYLIHNSHYAFLIWNNIFPGHRFFSSMKHWTSYFKTLVCNWKFHGKGKIFTHPSLPANNLKHSHLQLFWQPNTRQWGHPFFEERHTSCGVCVLQAPNAFINYIMKCHSAKWAIWFAVV